MTQEEIFYTFLAQFDLTSSKINQILSCMGDNLSLKSFCKAKFDEKVLSKSAYEKMCEFADENRVLNFKRNMESQDIVLINKFDDLYPSKLYPLDDSPFFLFCKGDLSLFESPTLAVVGSRKPSPYGRIVSERLVRDVADSGVTIISGLAYGVDSIAHRKCLEVGGKTIAVLGGGLNEIYPTQHEDLAREIAGKGLLVSEYSPCHKATKFTFPQRNRIIAGLSDGVLITEANFGSGTIHTRDFALDYGRNLYAVPGNIDSDLSALTNEIIKAGQGALVTEAKDILDDFHLSNNKTQKAIQLSLEEQKIISLLEDGMKTADFLSKNCGLSTNLFNSCLTTLEIRGLIKRMVGGFISLD